MGISAQIRKLVSGTAVDALGTSIDFTGIPVWAKRIALMLNGVSTNGTSNYLIRGITGESNVVYSGYSSSASTGANGATSNTGSVLMAVVGAVTLYNIVVELVHVTGSTWIVTSVGGTSSSNAGNISGGVVTLGADLTGIRLTTVNGVDTFDAGSVNIMWE